MKRKVLRVGRSSLAVSLPKTFVETNSVDSGQEIDVKHHGASLTVKCDKPTLQSKNVDISEFSTEKNVEKILDKVLGALFRQGLDKFSIKCPSESKADVIRKILHEGKVHMYEEPSQQEENKITVHSSITHFDEDALENLMAVTIKEIYRNFDQFVSYLENNELTEGSAKSLAEKDRVINDHTDICKRIINKDVTNYESTALYNFTDRLEKIGDEVRDLIMYSAKNKGTAQEYLDLFKEIKEFFFMLLSAKTGFSVKKINSFYEEYYDINKELEKCSDTHIYHHCRNITGLIADAYSNLMVCYL